jgi:hypothetical protein
MFLGITVCTIYCFHKNRSEAAWGIFHGLVHMRAGLVTSNEQDDINVGITWCPILRPTSLPERERLCLFRNRRLGHGRKDGRGKVAVEVLRGRAGRQSRSPPLLRVAPNRQRGALHQRSSSCFGSFASVLADVLKKQ